MNIDAEKRRRSLRNRFLVEQVQTNPDYSFALYNPQDTFFPPRPTIKKDKEALEFIHQTARKPKLSVVDGV